MRDTCRLMRWLMRSSANGWSRDGSLAKGGFATPLVLLLVASAQIPAPGARAMCNLIPAAEKEIRSVKGLVDRALAAPGAAVTVRADPVCDGSFAGFPEAAAANQVVLRFEPPGSAS